MTQELSEASASPAQFDALLDFLLQTHGFDFSGYKRPSLIRRMDKRLQELRLRSWDDYLDYLQVHPEEFQRLFDTILINVTAFFRDPASWDYLRDTALPQLLGGIEPTARIRVWSAGCASGEEAYSLAMVMADVLGVDDFLQRVKIYATDVDENALAKARPGMYTPKEVETVDEKLIDKYFERQDNGVTFRGDLRRCVIFGRHDLAQDAPISRLDLLVCRNTLMYFNAETQRRILSRLHYALNETGLLFMGRSEMLLTHSTHFAPVYLKHRIFMKVQRRPNLEGLSADLLTRPGEPQAESSSERLREHSAEAVPIALLTVDAANTVTSVNAAARALLALGHKDVGRRLQDLDVSYRPVQLRSAVEEAHRSSVPVTLPDVEWGHRDGKAVFIDVVVTPVFDQRGGRLGTTIAFIDTTPSHRLHVELERTREELETAYEELQSTNEELETTNEELQSTVEELETTNEELQSANEELETMNEELQSTNAELQVINIELRDRAEEVDRLNNVSDSILNSLQMGLVVIDADKRVRVWNGRAEDFWGLRQDEVIGRDFFELDIGLRVDQLEEAVTACLRDTNPKTETRDEMRAMNRRGRTMRYAVTCRPLLGPRLSRDGVVIVMEELGGAVSGK